MLSTKYNNIGNLKVERWKNLYSANTKQRKAGVIILISNEIVIRAKKITGDREGYYMVNGSTPPTPAKI